MAHKTVCRIPDYIQFYLVSGYVGRSSVCPVIVMQRYRHGAYSRLGRHDPSRRNIDPSARPIALEDAVEDSELPQAVGELRVLDWAARSGDRGIEAPEDLFERVVVAFAVATWKIG